MLAGKERYNHATLCFPINDGKVLLAEKQKKIGAGLLNGFGGKREPVDATIEDTNIREVMEEVGIGLLETHKVGEIAFRNPSDDEQLRNLVVHIYLATKWSGEPTETSEMEKIGWYDIQKLNFDKFLSADRLFLPQILGGRCVKGEIRYNDDWSVRKSRIDIVDSFD